MNPSQSIKDLQNEAVTTNKQLGNEAPGSTGYILLAAQLQHVLHQVQESTDYLRNYEQSGPRGLF